MENYRPIYKVYVLAQVFQSIILDQLFLDSNIIIFIRSPSVESNLLFLYTEYLPEDITKVKKVDAIYADFINALKKIDYQSLQNKFRAAGIHGNIYDGLNRTYVQIDHNKQLVAVLVIYSYSHPTTFSVNLQCKSKARLR